MWGIAFRQVYKGPDMSVAPASSTVAHSSALSEKSVTHAACQRLTPSSRYLHCVKEMFLGGTQLSYVHKTATLQSSLQECPLHMKHALFAGSASPNLICHQCDASTAGVRGSSRSEKMQKSHAHVSKVAVQGDQDSKASICQAGLQAA